MDCKHKHKKYLRKTKKYGYNSTYEKKLDLYSAMRGGFMSVSKKYLDIVNQICVESGLDESHGLNHFLVVLCNTTSALENYEGEITEREKLLVKLAALLHDIDDHKYFPDNHNFENARKVLTNPEIREIDRLSDNEIATILLMIYLVSSSKHGDTIQIGLPDWYFYPRYADRLEAIGVIGVKRTFEYTTHKKQPLYVPGETQFAETEEELWNIATEERYKSYNGKSKSMMDHFYDKLLRIGNYPIKNKFFMEETGKKIAPLIEFALLVGKKKSVEDSDVLEFLELHKSFKSDCDLQLDAYIRR